MHSRISGDGIHTPAHSTIRVYAYTADGIVAITPHPLTITGRAPAEHAYATCAKARHARVALALHTYTSAAGGCHLQPGERTGGGIADPDANVAVLGDGHNGLTVVREEMQVMVG